MIEKFFEEDIRQPKIEKPETEKPIEKLKFVKCTIEHLDEKMAQIKLEDGQIINWPKEKLLENSQEGDEVELSLLGKEELAKEILNTILKPSEENE
jgi:hypothetical protein